MKYNLPKGYLSYSSMEMWRSSKDQFRMKYYSQDVYNFETPYTKFGKFIAETFEDKKAKKAHPVLCKIPSYSVSEFPLEVEIDGVPIKGFIDSFDPKKNRIIEYKTGVRKPGNQNWSDVRFKKHNQTVMYSVAVKELLGEVHPDVKLIWMETCWREECVTIPFGEQIITECGPHLGLTGHFEVFKRTIEPWELEWFRKEIVKTAQEIHDDYTLYLQHSNKFVDN